jgi:hypothetical protein
VIKDNIITIRYRPEALARYCFIYEYWRKGKVSKSMCDSYLDGESDHIFCRWGEKFSSKTVYWTVSAVVAKMFFEIQHHSWYVKNAKDHNVDMSDNHIQYHVRKVAILSTIYDMYLDFFNYRSAQLFGGEDELYTIFKIHHEVAKLHDDAMDKYHGEDGEVDLDMFGRREILFTVMCQLTRIKINDYKVIKDFKRVTIEEWKDGTYPKRPL